MEGCDAGRPYLSLAISSVSLLGGQQSDVSLSRLLAASAAIHSSPAEPQAPLLSIPRVLTLPIQCTAVFGHQQSLQG